MYANINDRYKTVLDPLPAVPDVLHHEGGGRSGDSEGGGRSCDSEAKLYMYSYSCT